MAKTYFMKAAIVYKGKYGATRQYVEWLGEALKLPVLTVGDVAAAQIPEADFLLIGTSVYYGRFRIRKWLRENVKAISGKKLFLFVVNATSPDEQAKRNKFIEDNVPKEVRNQCETFFLPGRLIHSQLHFFDRFMVNMSARMVKDPEKKKAALSDLDEVKKENLAPLVDAVQKFSSAGRVEISKQPAPPMKH